MLYVIHEGKPIPCVNKMLKNVIVTAKYETEMLEPQLTANWNSGDCCAVYHDMKRSE